MMKIPTLVAITGAGFALVFLSACSSVDGNSTANQSGAAVSAANTPAEAIAVSLQRSIDTRTAQMDLTAAIDGSSFIGAQTVTGTGSVDFEGRRAQAHLDLLGVGIDGIVDGSTVYAKSTILGSDSWYRASAPADSARGSEGLTTVWAKLFDPTQMFATIKDASSSMTEAGHETVRGVDTIHYTGTIAVPQGRAGSKTASVPVDVWVDGEGLVARIQTSLSGMGAGGGVADMLSGKVTIEFHDYGKALSITAPPADQVKDASEALSIFGGGKDAGRTRTP
jgi:hypothetical protein